MDGLFMETTPQYGDNNEGWQKGKEYEEWVKFKYPQVYNGGLRKRELNFFVTEKDQFTGETQEGIEIKFDDKIYTYCFSGRIYIETDEKKFKENSVYVRSGIYRQDNTKLYLIGDYTIWFIFSKKYLVWLDNLDPPFLYRVKTDTSIGFCIPLENSKKICLDYKEF